MKPIPPITKFFLASALACAGMAAFVTPAAHAATPQTGLTSVFHNFDGTHGDEALTGLLKATDGNYYGTTYEGGTYNYGTVFKLTPAGVYSVLHSFKYEPLDNPPVYEGISPSILIQGKDGNLYGITNTGGTNLYYPQGSGTIYKLSLSGVYTKLYEFDKGNGATDPGAPVALVEHPDGNFYGLTRIGGPDAKGNEGAFFRFNATSKTLTVLYTFESTDPGIGATPEAQLTLGKDGNFYSTTSFGGGTDPTYKSTGTVFQITTAGAVKLIHAFSSDPNGLQDPPAGDENGVIQGIDGNLYGSTAQGGTQDFGTIYRCTLAGAFSYLHQFPDEVTGAGPSGPLRQGADGNFYGGLRAGFDNPDGPYDGIGGYFQVKADGTYTLLHKFDYHTTTGPIRAFGQLLEISKGTFLGVTAGGNNNYGTITKLVVSPAIVSAPTATAMLNKAFSYQIAASNSPTSYGVQGLAAGLSVNATTGLISGTPTKAGTFMMTINASNAAGKGSATLTLTVTGGGPVITSAKTASGKAGTAFSYQITASGSPTSFGVQGLPAGLSVNATTGLISGTPQVGGTSTLTVNAYNAAGKGSATVTLTIANGPPVITSAKTASGKVGVAFSYQIKASGSPTGYGVQGLPAGLTINGTTGLISGTPAKAGTSTLTLNAYNSLGKGSATLTLTVTN